MSMLNNTMQSRDDAYLPCDPLERRSLAFYTVGESMTRQSEKASADVNAIVERFARTGQLPPNIKQPIYDDVTGLQVDLTEAYNASIATRTQYESDIKVFNEKQAAAAATAAQAAQTPPSPPPEPSAPVSPTVK